MNAKDQMKIIKAGFTIIREDEINLRIKKKVDSHAWATFKSGFKNITAMRKEMKQLLQLNNVVED